jgi:hypothetical protein
VPAIVQKLPSNDTFLGHLRRGTVVIGPAIAYLALPKTLMSWVHRDDVPIHHPDRDWLRQRLPRAYASIERIRGELSRDEVVEAKEQFVLKPALRGGSDGVKLGCDIARDDWASAVDAMWDDPTWVIQKMVVPVRASSGDWVSVGIMDTAARWWVQLRTSPNITVNARQSAFIRPWIR